MLDVGTRRRWLASLTLRLRYWLLASDELCQAEHGAGVHETAEAVMGEGNPSWSYSSLPRCANGCDEGKDWSTLDICIIDIRYLI
jgi:hypothetical protein